MGSKCSGSNLHGKGDIRNFSCHRAVKHLEHGMKVVEKELEKRLHGIVTINEVQTGLIPRRLTIEAVLISIKLQEEHNTKRKSCICLLWT